MYQKPKKDLKLEVPEPGPGRGEIHRNHLKTFASEGKIHVMTLFSFI